MMLGEIKSKPIILNGFTCVPREQREADKNLVKRGNGIVFFFFLANFSRVSNFLLACWVLFYLLYAV